MPSVPDNVTLTVSPASTLSQLLVRWTIDPPSELISNYTIYVTRLDVGNTVLTYTSIITQLNIPSNDLDPGDLDAGEQVLVHVSASNSAGEGARSPGVIGRTREERKPSLSHSKNVIPPLLNTYSISRTLLIQRQEKLQPTCIPQLITCSSMFCVCGSKVGLVTFSWQPFAFSSLGWLDLVNR